MTTTSGHYDNGEFNRDELLAYQGKEGCDNPMCTRINGKCIGWHCPRCHEPCSSQGHHVCTQRTAP